MYVNIYKKRFIFIACRYFFIMALIMHDIHIPSRNLLYNCYAISSDQLFKNTGRFSLRTRGYIDDHWSSSSHVISQQSASQLNHNYDSIQRSISLLEKVIERGNKFYSNSKTPAHLISSSSLIADDSFPRYSRLIVKIKLIPREYDTS